MCRLQLQTADSAEFTNVTEIHFVQKTALPPLKVLRRPLRLRLRKQKLRGGAFQTTNLGSYLRLLPRVPLCRIFCICRLPSVRRSSLWGGCLVGHSQFPCNSARVGRGKPVGKNVFAPTTKTCVHISLCVMSSAFCDLPFYSIIDNQACVLFCRPSRYPCRNCFHLVSCCI